MIKDYVDYCSACSVKVDNKTILTGFVMIGKCDKCGNKTELASIKIEDPKMPNQSKVSYTPGPWDVQQSGNQLEIFAEPSQQNIAVIGLEENEPGEYSDIPDEEQKANAQLIAAAPQLVEALRAVKHFNNSDNPMTEDQLEAILDKALKAAGIE